MFRFPLSVIFVGGVAASGMFAPILPRHYKVQVAAECNTTAKPDPTPPPVAPADFDWFSIKASDVVMWTGCFGKFQCSRLRVPLDYSTPNGAGPSAEIALQLLPATDKKNYKGVLLFNPGGPGGSGAQSLLELGDQMVQVVGPGYDIVGFDPRGVGATIPNAQCFTPADWDAWLPTDVLVLHSDDNTVAYARARDEVVAKKCAVALGGNGKDEPDPSASVEEWGGARFMDTGSVATDMLHISQALGQEKVNYWGISYGTVLGQYFAAMYPDKVGLMLIDGVADGINWRNGDVITNLQDSDRVMEQFFALCSQGGPSVCPIAEATANSTAARVDRILESVRLAPIAVPERLNGSVITEDQVLAFVRPLMYQPSTGFPLIAQTYAALETRNLTALAQFNIQPPNTALPVWMQANEALQAVACSDYPDLSLETIEQSKAIVQKATQVSRWSGPTMARTRLQCVPWSIRPKNPFSGALTAEHLPGKMLVASNLLDPVCPLADAIAVTGRYAGAVLLRQDAPGHTVSLSMSSCAAQAIGTFFQTGVLPPAGTVCQPDVLPFVGAPKPTIPGQTA